MNWLRRPTRLIIPRSVRLLLLLLLLLRRISCVVAALVWVSGRLVIGQWWRMAGVRGAAGVRGVLVVKRNASSLGLGLRCLLVFAFAAEEEE